MNMQETLNHLGAQFLSFAWPMLWQSSLLIAVVFVADLMLAHKVRAAVRHALWLVVLVKLLLPPTLALPTGAAWWLFPAKPVVETPTPKNYVITYNDVTPLPSFVPQSVPESKPPAPRLNPAGWTLLAATTISAGLLLWLLFRWRQVSRKVRDAASAPELGESLEEARVLARLHLPLKTKIVDEPISPAVCGLFLPVILLPRRLAEKLPANQLRAVLLHEAFHIRRMDVWINCAQALLQIIYWWHPLVWLVNSRIRRVREEAVDDAVMLALSHEADIYAPTLLEVAKLAFRRPLVSLGLIGIIESRSALRQRIERIVNFDPPRKAGLTFISFCGIFMFSAIALPMGQGPAPAESQTAPLSAGPTQPESAPAKNPPSILIQAEIYQMPMNDLEKVVPGLQFNPAHDGEDAWWLASPEKYAEVLGNLKKSGLTPLRRPRVLTNSGMPAQFFVGNDTNGTDLYCLPKATSNKVDLSVHGDVFDARGAGATNRFLANAVLGNQAGMVVRVQNNVSNVVVFLNVEIITNQLKAHLQQRLEPNVKPAPHRTNAPIQGGRQAIRAKLDQIHLDSVSYDNLPLSEVVKQLSEQCRLRDPEHRGINFLINSNPNLSSQPAAAAAEPPDVGSFLIKIPSLTDVRLADVLDAIVLVSDHPLKYSIQDFGIMFSAKDKDSQLVTRTFRVDPNTFYSGLQNVSAESFGTVQNSQGRNNGAVVGVVNAFPGAGGVRNAGQSGGGETQNGSGSLLDQRESQDATGNGQQNADGASKGSAAITARAKAYFTRQGLNLQNPPGKSVYYNDRSGLLFVKATESDMDTVERAIEAIMPPPPQTQTPSQIHIKAQFYEVPKGKPDGLEKFLHLTNPNVSLPVGILNTTDAGAARQMLESQKDAKLLSQGEFVTLSGRQAQVRANGTTVSTVGNPTLFQPNAEEVGPMLDLVPYILADGYTVNLTAISFIDKTGKPPLFATVNAWDGQTVVLAGLKESNHAIASGTPDKEVIVFITSTLINAAGGRVHSDDKMPFTRDSIPPQPPQAVEPPNGAFPPNAILRMRP